MQAPRWIESVLASVVDEDAVSVGIEHDRLAPEVGLVDGIALKVESCSLELPYGAIDIVHLEMEFGPKARYGSLIVLYTCSDGKAFGNLPGPIAHPCGRAAVALDKAGHFYELKKVKGGTFKFWTWPSRASDRAEIEKLSGQRAVPVLVLDDDGEVIAGSGAIVRWAAAHRPEDSTA